MATIAISLFSIVAAMTIGYCMARAVVNQQNAKLKRRPVPVRTDDHLRRRR